MQLKLGDYVIQDRDTIGIPSYEIIKIVGFYKYKNIAGENKMEPKGYRLGDDRRRIIKLPAVNMFFTKMSNTDTRLDKWKREK